MHGKPYDGRVKIRMGHLTAGYVIDEARRDEVNAQGRNYWWAYIAEVLDRLGLSAVEVPAVDLASRLSDLSLLFFGGTDARPVASDLDGWVRAGGILIACNSEGLDDLFGNEFAARIPQPAGEFSIGGEFHLKDTPFAKGIHSPLYPDKPLLAASDVRLVNPVYSQALAECESRAVITARRYGRGWAFYFGFDLAQTFWVIQQGRPVDADHDGDGYLRTGDAIVIEEREPEIAYTDELLFILQNIVNLLPFPLIHQLPPNGDAIPDILLFYGGDDEGSADIQVPAAEFMGSRGLPYHVNCMLKNGKFALGLSEVERMAAHGTEISLHYNFIDGFEHPVGFTRDDVETQTRAFVEHFGRLPVSSNFHWCRWTGWAEPAIWLSEQGIKADNSHFHRRASELNPVNSMGFAFGTSYPFHFYTDHAAGNRPLDVLELPIVAYEVGYDGEQTDFPLIEKALTLARHYQSTMNFFYHPIYIAEFPACRAAIDKLLSLIDESGTSVVHSTPDGLTRWWKDRSNTSIEDVRTEDGRLSFVARTPSPSGFIAKIPLASGEVPQVDLPHKVEEKFGRKWLLVALPPGETKLGVRL